MDGLTLKHSATHTKYWLIDYREKMPMKFNCGGVLLRPKLVLRIACTPTKNHLNTIKRQAAIDAVLDGQFLIW